MIHLPVTLPELADALRFAYTFGRSVALIPGIEAAGVTVSAEDAQHVRHWVFCDRIMPDRSRCARRTDHDGPCEPVTRAR
ncbi:hypothetical protein AB0873_17805 [Micromonospora sp. NPDC047707]|uniref:hypothetical protein n=1 Tax=Micromonospora sp. NPDC047707 TaxID=3154498 RepID=UPI0034524C06